MPASDLLALGPSVPLPLASCLAFLAYSSGETLSGWGGKGKQQACLQRNMRLLIDFTLRSAF